MNSRDHLQGQDGKILLDADEATGTVSLQIIDDYNSQDRVQSPLARAEGDTPLQFIEDPDSDDLSADSDEEGYGIAELMSRSGSPCPDGKILPAVEVVVDQAHPLAHSVTVAGQEQTLPVIAAQMEGVSLTLFSARKKSESLKYPYPKVAVPTSALDETANQQFPHPAFPEATDLSNEGIEDPSPVTQLSNLWDACGCCKAIGLFFTQKGKFKVDQPVTDLEAGVNKPQPEQVNGALRHRGN
jgi:hypothetical protein